MKLILAFSEFLRLSSYFSAHHKKEDNRFTESAPCYPLALGLLLLFVLVYFFELSVNDLLFRLAPVPSRAARGAAGPGLALLPAHLRIDFLGELVRRLGEIGHRLLDGVDVRSIFDALCLLERLLNVRALRVCKLCAVIRYRFLNGVDKGIHLVPRLGKLAFLLVFRCMSLALFKRLVNFFLAQAARSRDLD